MGIRKKIFVGFVIIGFILFLSGIISVFQLVGMEKSISGMLSNNLKSVDFSTYMLDGVESQSWNILDIITNEKTGNDARLDIKESDFENLILNAKSNLTVDGEKEAADLVETSYKRYIKVVKSIDSLFALNTPDAIKSRTTWFLDLYQPAHLQFNTSIQKLKVINQNALYENSMKLEGSFYRMLMPPIIAIAAGLFLIILFNYFVNLYFINPILRINKGIKLFLNSKISYNVAVDTKDEIDDLNEAVKVLISQFKKNTTANKSIIDFKK